MSDHASTMTIPETEVLSLNTRGFGLIAGVLGLLALGVSILLAFTQDNGGDRFFHAYLVGFGYWLTIALGALFFVMIMFLMRAGWSASIRRLAELTGLLFPLLAILALPVIFGALRLYDWFSIEKVAEDAILQGKSPFLNPLLFIVRLAVYFTIWSLLARYFYRKSSEQDATKDQTLSLQMERWSAPGMILFAVTLTFAGIDLFMSLDAHWYSTIFGVYLFGGSVMSFAALLIVMLVRLQHKGLMATAVTNEHYHDLGKYTFAFVFFWGYIAFSQFMLIWYGNIPEETAWFARRGMADLAGLMELGKSPGLTSDWAVVGIVLIFGHFIFPFLGFMSRHVKRRKHLLMGWALWLLLMHWVDLQYIIMPEAAPHGGGSAAPVVQWLDLTVFVGVTGIVLSGLAWILHQRRLVAVGDPRMPEALSLNVF